MAILTVDELREFVTSELSDDALQILLDATEEEIVRRAGPPGPRTETFELSGRLIALSRPAESITSVTQLVGSTSTTLAVDDYFARPDGYVLERVRTGTNPYSQWRGRTTVVYTPVDDTATREAVQVALIQATIDDHPGLEWERIGEWEQRFGTSSKDWNSSTEREAILRRLDPEPGMLVVPGGSW